MTALTAAQLKERADRHFPGIIAGDKKSFSAYYDTAVKSRGRTEDDVELDYAGLKTLFATSSQRYADQKLLTHSVSLAEGLYTIEWSWTALDTQTSQPIALSGRTVVSDLSATGKVRNEATVYASSQATREAMGGAPTVSATFQVSSVLPRDPGSLASATPRDPGSANG
jgi:hypothetical protein